LQNDFPHPLTDGDPFGILEHGPGSLGVLMSFDRLRRREFITLLGGAAAVWPLGARAQQPERIRRVGMLSGGEESNTRAQREVGVFKEELARLGWTEGRNLRIDLRFAGDYLDRLSVPAADIVGLTPDVVFVGTGRATAAVQQQTKTIPIVYIGPGPEAGLVRNITRPEGNITGFPILYPSIAGKWVELLKEADPRISRVALIWRNPSYLPFVEEAATALAVKVDAATTQNAAEIEETINAFAAEPNGSSLIVMPSAVSANRDNRDLIRRLAERHRLPTIHWDDAYPADGGLMSYGSNLEYLHRRAASYVDRILRGAKISELPVERPTKFELVINVKAAKAISLSVPASLLARADEVIE
jgi:putative ABC transport system substrate-binding protein